MRVTLCKVCPTLNASSANDTNVAVRVPMAGDIPEEDVISNDLENELLKFIKVLKIKNLINNSLKFFRKSC